ncbi:hypothetical protein AAZX31_18G107900 [Glycine max]
MSSIRFLWILMVSLTESCTLSQPQKLSMYDVLMEYGFPVGLLPKGAIGYSLNKVSGEFAVYFQGVCSFDIESYMFKYKSTITGVVSKDVRREVKILRALNGHNNLIQFYDAFEDQDNVYIIMELCEGGELLDMILSRGGKYLEDDAKAVMVQILNVAAFCHLQGVVHRDLKPELPDTTGINKSYLWRC